MKTKLHLKLILVICIVISFTRSSSAQLFWDQASSFNGTSSSYIAVKNSSRLNITGSFAFEVWLNPVNSISPALQHIFHKRALGLNGYSMSLSNGKISLVTNNSTRLIGNTIIPSNTWTHVAGRYNAVNGRFSIYINSELDTSVDISGAAPIANTDSLLIGRGKATIFPFNGLMDNIRIWDGVITPTFLSKIYRSISTSNSGIYDSLILSIPFQGDNSAGSDFSIKDFTSHDHLVVNNGVTSYSQNSRPSVTTSTNESIFLDGINDYLAGPDNSNVSPTSKITLEAWIFCDTSNVNKNVIIHKGSPLGGNANYQLSLQDNKLHAAINGNFSFESDYFSNSSYQWNHVAFTYDGTTGLYEFYVNGAKIGTGLNMVGSINDGNDSLYIGGCTSNDNFNGYIDEVRITNTVKSSKYIDEYLYKSIEDGNDSAVYAEAVYNFDGYLTSSADNGPDLNFRNNADFSHPAGIEDQPESPILRSNNFQNGFYVKQSNSRIPSYGTDGEITSSLIMNLDDSISDINVFVALNHTRENSLRIVLVSPEGDSCVLFNQNEFAAEEDNIVTVFDSDADSSLTNPSRYVSINPKIKPYNNLNSTFSGKKTKGFWQLKIIDYYLGDVGILYAWGIQFNNHTQKQIILSSQCLIQGFYNSSTNLTIRDTVRCFLRNSFPPYSIVDSSRSYIKNTGQASFQFTSPLLTSTNEYFIQLTHRNSIETWSSGFIKIVYFSNYGLAYNFTSDSSKTYGENVISVDDTPKRFAIYSGDVNQDGTIDASDVSETDNDAFSSASGYVRTDVTGDDFVDAGDVSIVDNNAFNSVSVITP